MIGNDPKVSFGAPPFPPFLPYPQKDITEKAVRITIFAKLILENVSTESLLILEEECSAKVEGDFAEIIKENLGHSPSQDFIPYEDFVDKISITLPFFPKKEFNGSISFNIPLNLIYENDPQKNKRIIVVDYTEVVNQVITRRKGETSLYSIDLQEELKKIEK